MEPQTDNPEISRLYRQVQMLRQSRKVYFIAGILLGMILTRAFEYYF